VSELELQNAVIDLARVLGYRVAHFRAARTADGWRTPVAADGAGFPDLVLVKRRVIFAELKSAAGKLRAEQSEWRISLQAAGAEYRLWNPDSWVSGEIEDCLARETTWATRKPRS
jgi:hypothetical protein